MSKIPRRVQRERKTVSVMIGLYCRDKHGTSNGSLCAECESLCEYALFRIEKCPFCPDKPTCANCPIHCYKPDQREQIRTAMKYAGPRMTLRHPYLALMHILDGRREVEDPRSRNR